MPLKVTPEGWVWIRTTRCFPPIEPLLSSDLKSKSKNRQLTGEVFVCSTVFHPFLLCRYAVAESDCNLAIALDGNYFKAYARRGAARLALKKLESALEGKKKKQSDLIITSKVRWRDIIMFGYRLRDGSEAWPWKHRGPERSHENQRGDRVMMNLFTSVWLSFPSTRWNYFSVTAFQALGHQTVQNEAPQPKQEAVPADTEQQRLMEEQQRRQEAVLQKDRVGLASVTASSSCLIRLNWMRFNFGSTCPSNSFGSKFATTG